MRKDCSLSKLTHEQQADLFDWLSSDTLDSVKQRVAKSPPDGFGIKTHITTLSRFYQQRHAEIRDRDRADAIASASANQDPKPFIECARRSHAPPREVGAGVLDVVGALARCDADLSADNTWSPR